MAELEFLNGYLVGYESLKLEAKSARDNVPKSMWETYSAFANTDGGTIVLGLCETENGLKLEGVVDPYKMVKDLWTVLNNPQKISKNILSDKDVRILTIDGKDIIQVDVPRALRCDRPVYVGNNINYGTYRRNGEGDYHCSQMEIRLMIADSIEKSSDSRVLSNIPCGVLNRRCISAYRKMVDSKRPDNRWVDESDESYLRLIGAVGKGDDGEYHPTLAGLLMFGSENYIVEEIPYYFLDYLEYGDGTYDWTYRMQSGAEDWTGNLFEFYWNVNNRIRLMSDRKFIIDRDMKRVDDDELIKAKREAVINALVNADYSGSGGVVVEWRYDKFTVRNPGLFRIPIDMAEKGGVSDPRNPILMKMFMFLGDAERAGSGVRRIIRVCEDLGLSRPIITELTLPLSVSVVISQEAGNGVSSTLQERVLDYIRADPNVSIRVISEKLGVTRYRVSEILNSLRSEGTITKEGSTRGKWIILKE